MRQTIYDNFAAGYDRFFNPLEKRFLRRWREETLSYLPDNSRLLEIGAGTGLNFKFYPLNCKCIASELSLKMLEVAHRKIDFKEIKLVQANAEILPFTENSFDAAFATLVFCSIPNPQNTFQELQRVVKKGGKGHLLEHVRPKGLLGFIFDFFNIFTVALIQDHFNRRTVEMAEKSGLKIIDVKQKTLGIVNLIICETVK